MDKPHKYTIKTGSDSGKALIFIPGMGTEEKTITGKEIDAILKAGWDGDIHHLWWDASTKAAMVRVATAGAGAGAVLGLPGAIIGLGITSRLKFKKTKDAAKKTGRKHLPNMLRKELPNKRITFVAHSLGAYMLYKLFKKPHDYPVDNTIEDVILLGGAVSRKKTKWERTNFRKLINVYNKHDKTLKSWKIFNRVLGGRIPVSPCGRKVIKPKYVSKVVNINLSHIIGDSHGRYYEVFLNGMLKYDGTNWITR